MEEKTCFLFGHAVAPSKLLPCVAEAVERHYIQYDVRIFVVGCRGSFDSYAATAIKQLKKKYNDISLVLLLAYHPAERPITLTNGFDSTFYPPLENIPRQFAIVKANQYMVKYADSIICYARHPGNSRNLLEYAQRQHAKSHIPISNVAELYEEIKPGV